MENTNPLLLESASETTVNKEKLILSPVFAPLSPQVIKDGVDITRDGFIESSKILGEEGISSYKYFEKCTKMLKI